MNFVSLSHEIIYLLTLLSTFIMATTTYTLYIKIDFKLHFNILFKILVTPLFALVYALI